MELTLGVTLAVLGAGFMHASWNALVKGGSGGDPLLDTSTVVAGSMVCAGLMLPFLPLPREASWPMAFASMLIHFGYYLTLTEAYRAGDLSFAYPLMRGTAPLLVTVLGIVFLGELPSLQIAVGVLLICAGIVAIAFAQRHHHPRAAVGWALANAAIIGVYTLIDGAGARASGNALAYVAWLTFFEAALFLAWVRWHRGAASVAYVRSRWRRGMVGGFFSVAAYGIVLWAMTRAPVAAVSALRETSVLFAALIGAVVLKERLGVARIVGATGVVLGVAALKL